MLAGSMPSADIPLSKPEFPYQRVSSPFILPNLLHPESYNFPDALSTFIFAKLQIFRKRDVRKEEKEREESDFGFKATEILEDGNL